MIGYGGGTNQYKVWDLIRNNVVISRDVVFIEGKPIEQTPAVYVEELRIIHDSITVLPKPSETKEPRQLLPAPPQSEHPDPKELEEPEAVDPQILLQESERTIEPQESVTSREAIGRSTSTVMPRTSARSD